MAIMRRGLDQLKDAKQSGRGSGALTLRSRPASETNSRHSTARLHDYRAFLNSEAQNRAGKPTRDG